MSFVQECVSLSRQHLLAGYLGEAEMSCRSALASDPAHADATHLLGVIALQSQRPVEAAELFRRAIELDGRNAQYYNSLGVLYYGCQHFDEAEAAFRQAVVLSPADAVARNNLGNALRALGRLDDAQACFRAAITLYPGYAEAHNNLGNLLRESGQPGEAEFCLRHALALAPDNLDTLYNLAILMAGTGRLAQAGQMFAQVMAGDSGRHDAAIGLAQVFHAQGRTDDAITLLAGVQVRAPLNQAVAAALQELRATQMPAERLARIANRDFNEALEAALLKAVRPGDVVLEIGTGGGLGALMAARAGAGQVVTLEPLAPVAEVVRETVALNGYADRVTVMTGNAQGLEVGGDLPRPADVLVTDLAGPALLAPDMMAVIRFARRNLARPGAKIIPAAATVWAQLIQADGLCDGGATTSGFDMSRYSLYQAPGPRQIDLAAGSVEMLSDPFPVWFFDFRATQAETAIKTLSVDARRSGTAQGVVLWFDLHMDESITYSSRSTAPTNHWRQTAFFFGRDLRILAGQPVMLGTGYDQNRIHFFI